MKKVVAIGAAAIGLAMVVAVLLSHRDAGEAVDSSVERDAAGEQAEQQRLQRLERKKQALGGLPLELALRNAKTEEQREFLRRELAYQSQSREQALEEARSKLADLESRARAADDDKEVEALRSKIDLIDKVIASLEGGNKGPAHKVR